MSLLTAIDSEAESLLLGLYSSGSSTPPGPLLLLGLYSSWASTPPGSLLLSRYASRLLFIRLLLVRLLLVHPLLVHSLLVHSLLDHSLLVQPLSISGNLHVIFHVTVSRTHPLHHLSQRSLSQVLRMAACLWRWRR